MYHIPPEYQTFMLLLGILLKETASKEKVFIQHNSTRLFKVLYIEHESLKN